MLCQKPLCLQPLWVVRYAFHDLECNARGVGDQAVVHTGAKLVLDRRVVKEVVDGVLLFLQSFHHVRPIYIAFSYGIKKLPPPFRPA